MQRYTTLILAALTLAIFAITTAGASATTLPSLLQLVGVTSGTLVAQSATAITTFAGAVTFTCKGYKTTLTFAAEMTSLGPGLECLLNCMLGTKTCKANGDTAGNVLVLGEWHTVLAAAGGGANLFLILFLFIPALTIECQGTNSVATGSKLTDTEPFGREVTRFTTGTGKCSGTTPAFTSYLNDSGTSTTANLKSETGGIKSNSCEEEEGTQE